MKALIKLTLKGIGIGLLLVVLTLSTYVQIDHRLVKPVGKFYYTLYKNDIPIPYTKSFTAQFLPALPYNNIAYAYTDTSVGHMVISEKHWADLTDNEKNVVVYHEMIHNVLGESHDWINTKSIMYPSKKLMKIKDADEMLQEYIDNYKKKK